MRKGKRQPQPAKCYSAQEIAELNRRNVELLNVDTIAKLRRELHDLREDNVAADLYIDQLEELALARGATKAELAAARSEAEQDRLTFHD